MVLSSTYPLLLRGLIPLPQFTSAVLSLLLEVGMFLYLCLVEAVDNRVFALFDEDSLDLVGSESGCKIRIPGLGRGTNLSLVFEADLANSHATVFFQVRPWRVYHCDVVLFVS